MTKEEIRNVLELALEYYKLEIYGTGKESEPPTEARINWIYERMKPSLPPDIDEAAKKIVIQLHPSMEYSSVLGDHLTMGELVELVKAGAEWMAGQGETIDGEILTTSDYGWENIRIPKKLYPLGTKVTIQIRKKQ